MLPESPLMKELRDTLRMGAIRPADLQRAQEILDVHPELVQARFFDHKTPLHWAAAILHLGIVQNLIALGADVNTSDDSGYTPLHWALIRDQNTYRNDAEQVKVVTALLEAGVDPNVTALSGHPAMWWIEYYLSRPNFLPLLELLLRHGADPNWQDSGGYMLLMKLYEPPEALALMVRYGANVNLSTHYGSTPLLSAVWGNNAEAVRELLALGARVNHRSAIARSALHYAAMFNPGYELVQALLEAGANPALPDRQKHTALHFAAASCDLESLRLLLAAGADINARSKRGETPLAIAEGERRLTDEVEMTVTHELYQETAAFLRKHGATL